MLSYQARAEKVELAIEELQQAVPELDEEIERTLDETWSGSNATLAALLCAQLTLPYVPEATEEQRSRLEQISTLAEDLRVALGVAN